MGVLHQLSTVGVDGYLITNSKICAYDRIQVHVNLLCVSHLAQPFLWVAVSGLESSKSAVDVISTVNCRNHPCVGASDEVNP